MIKNFKPFISVITIHNSEDSNLISTLTSVKKIQQEFASLESIVVVPNSIRSHVESLILANKWTSILADDTGFGPFEAMNTGLHLAKGKYVWFLNSGDYIDDILIAKTCLSEIKRLKPRWLVSAVYFRNKKYIWNLPSGNSLKFMFAINSFCHQGTIFEKDFLESLGRLAENSSVADWALTLKALRKVEPIAFTQPFVTYQGGGISMRPSYFRWAIDINKARSNTKSTIFKLMNLLQFGIALILFIRSKWHVFIGLINPSISSDWKLK